MDILSQFRSFLAADDVVKTPLVLVIDRVEMKQVDPDKPDKPVLFFNGVEKGLVLNRTNAQMIAGFFGTETTSWNGKQVELYHAFTQLKGKTVACIRVRLPGRPA